MHAIRSNQEFPIHGLTGELRHPRFSNDGSLLYIQVHAATRWDRKVFNVASGESVADLGDTSSEITEPVFVFSPDGRYLMSYRDRALEVFDTRTWKPAPGSSSDDSGPVNRWGIFIPATHDLLLTCQSDGKYSAFIWDLSTGKRALLFTNADSVTGFASPDGKWFVIQRGPGTPVEIWNVQGTPAPRHLKAETNSAYRLTAAAFTPDSSRILLGFTNGKTLLLEVSTGNRVAFYNGEQGAIGMIAFSPDSRLVATTHPAESNIVRIWKVPAGKRGDGFVQTVRGATVAPADHFGEEEAGREIGASGTPVELQTAFLNEFRGFSAKMTRCIASFR